MTESEMNTAAGEPLDPQVAARLDALKDNISRVFIGQQALVEQVCHVVAHGQEEHVEEGCLLGGDDVVAAPDEE